MLKESVFDEFKCTADKCDMTCCNGWAIKVEKEDLDKWKANEETHYLCEMIKKRNSDDGFNMKLEPSKGCVMLDECGLCNIVKKHGDEFLSKTCADFPRKMNIVREYIDEENEGDILLNEYSLSGACPHVLELLYENENTVVNLKSDILEKIEFPYEYKVRNFIIEIFGNKNLSLQEKIILSFSFLHECLECEWEEDVYTLMDNYKEEENIKELIKSKDSFDIDKNEAFLEICQTFYDVSLYYKEEEMYRPYLQKLSEFCETVEDNLEELADKWEIFKKEYSKHDEYMARVMIAEIFSDCVSDDLGEVIEDLQCIVLEYIMTRVSVFINNNIGNCSDLQLIQKYMALYIRMIGHNIEGVCEYWIENFEDSILSIDYLYMLI